MCATHVFQAFNFATIVGLLWAPVLIIGLIWALAQRIHEIKNGDDDDIGKY